MADLGFGFAQDIDEQGRVIGFDQTSALLQGKLWRPASIRGTVGTISDLGDLGGGEGYALGINEALQIAGGSSDAAGFHATLWEGTTPHLLTEPAGATGGFGNDISDQLADGSRLVAGIADFPAASRPTLWRTSGSGGGLTTLGTEVLPGLVAGGSGQASGVSASGLVVGDAVSTGSDLVQPVKWSLAGSTWVVTALGLLPNQTYGQALDVNAGGTAVGHNGSGGVGCNRGVVWPANSPTPTGLPDLANGPCSMAYAINDAGQITGWAVDAGHRAHAVLWQPAGGGAYSILNLEELRGTRSSEGRGLNEPQPDGSGGQVLEVVGVSGSSRATLWKVRLP